VFHIAGFGRIGGEWVGSQFHGRLEGGREQEWWVYCTALLTCINLITLGWLRAIKHWISVVARSAAPMLAMMALLGKNFKATFS